MDAVKFIQERNRLCAMYTGCTKCPVFCNNTCLFSATNGGTPEDQVKILSAWVAKHPLKTRQDVFLEQYPEASIDANGVLDVCPASIVKSHRANGGGCVDYIRNCDYCLREFWMQEVE